MGMISRRRLLRVALPAFVAFGFGMPALGQSPATPAAQTSEPQYTQPIPRPNGATGISVGGPHVSSLAPGGFQPTIRQVTGKPYSLELESEQKQTLADGTNISRKTSIRREYRDSEGRTRTENEPIFSGRGVTSYPLIQIADPVAQFRYMINTRTKTANRVPAKVLTGLPQVHPGMHVATSYVVAGASTNPPDGPHLHAKREPLGTQVFEGVAAEGFRITTTFPVGSMGNDRPFETVCEQWTSPELGTMVMTKCSDPRSGETTTRLTHAQLSEPDAALFRVPDGYKVFKDGTPWYKRLGL